MKRNEDVFSRYSTADIDFNLVLLCIVYGTTHLQACIIYFVFAKILNF